MTEEAKSSVEATVREICRGSRKNIRRKRRSGLCWKDYGREDTIAELWRREGVHSNMYYKWSKDFLEVGKQRLTGDMR